MLAEAPSPTPPPQPEQGQSFSDIDVRAQKHGCNDISRVLSAVWPAASAAWRVRRGALSSWLSPRTLRAVVQGGGFTWGFLCHPPVERRRVSETHGAVLRSFERKAPAKCRARVCRALRRPANAIFSRPTMSLKWPGPVCQRPCKPVSPARPWKPIPRAQFAG